MCKLSRILLRNSSTPIEKTLGKVLDILVNAQGSQRTSAARVELNGREVRTGVFSPTDSIRSCPILANGVQVGVLEVGSPAGQSADEPEMSSAVENALIECAAACLGLVVERSQAYDALRLTEGQFSALGTLTRDGVWVLDADGCTTYVNPKIEEMLGYPTTEIIGKPIGAFMDEGMSDATQSRLGLSNNGVISRCEVELARRDGNRIWVRIETSPPKSSAERVSETLLVVSDITETKRRQVEIVRRSVFDELLSQILSGFASCSRVEIEARIQGALRGIAVFVGVDHAWVIKFSDDRATWSVTHEWSRTGAKTSDHLLQRMPMTALEWSGGMVKSGHSVTVNAPGDYPQEAVLEQQLWVDAGCVSRVCVPIKAIRGDVVGCLGLHSHARQMTWSEGDVARLTLVANAVALAMERGPTMQVAPA